MYHEIDAPRREKFYGVVNRTIARLRGEGERWDLLDRNLEVLRWSKEDVQAFQRQRLRELLKHAKNHVPYYRRLFREYDFNPEEVESTQDLERLPVLTKAKIHENFDDLVAENYDRSELKTRKTGGSSGETLTFHIAKSELEAQMAMCQRTLVMAGVRPAGSQVKFWGYFEDQTWGNRLSPLTGRLYCASGAATEENFHRWLRYIRSVQPVMAYGYASFMAEFAQFALENGGGVRGMKAAFSTAEMLDSSQREIIERGFQTKVYNAYGCRELPRIASECPHGNMHIMSDDVVMEFADDATVSAGGNILLTPLSSYAMPLIRYQVGDSGSARDETCSCGLPFPLMSMDVGKEYLVIRLPSGRLLHSSSMTSRLHRVEGVRRFQIQHRAEGALHVLFEAGDGYASESRAQLDRILAEIDEELLGEQTTITAEKVDEIEPTPAGKRPMFRSFL